MPGHGRAARPAGTAPAAPCSSKRLRFEVWAHPSLPSFPQRTLVGVLREPVRRTGRYVCNSIGYHRFGVVMKKCFETRSISETNHC